MNDIPEDGRAREFLLASLVTAYPDTELREALAPSGPLALAYGALGPIARALSDDLRDVQSAYIDLFDRGKERVPLYETEHGPMRGLAKGHDLADIAGFYRAFGLALDHEAEQDMLDHIAIELEFYSVLLLKQQALSELGDTEGGEIVEDARKKFLREHLGRFARLIADQAVVSGHELYGPIFDWCARLVEGECERLSVEPVPLEFFRDSGERDDPSCGAVRLPVCD